MQPTFLLDDRTWSSRALTRASISLQLLTRIPRGHKRGTTIYQRYTSQCLDFFARPGRKAAAARNFPSLIRVCNYYSSTDTVGLVASAKEWTSIFIVSEAREIPEKRLAIYGFISFTRTRIRDGCLKPSVKYEEKYDFIYIYGRK